MSDTIVKNLQFIENKIKNSCLQYHRDPCDVKLLLATKTVSVERIKKALQTGHTLIGENKVQELREKHGALQDIPHINHFIGHLQSNKIKHVLQLDVSCIQSVDRLELAEKLNQKLGQKNKKMDIFIQVNTSLEPSKFGISPAETIKLIQQIATLENLHIKGLMTIGLFSSDRGKVRKCYQLLKQLQQDIIKEQIPNVNMDELSMGMSADYDIAIEEGATIVRIGTAVFGERIYPDSYYWNEQNEEK